MRQYPHVYSQRDPQWASQRLGTVDGITIGGYGCILTSQAMKAGYYGHEIKPNALDDIYTNQNIYVSGDLTPDDAVCRVFPDIKLLEVKDWTNSPADLNYLKSTASDATKTITLEVDFDHDPSDGIQTHFVELHEFDGTTLTIYDPWYGSDDNFTLHYGTNLAQTLLKAVVYQGTPATASPAPSSGGNYYKGYDLTNPDSMKVAVDVLVRLQQGDLVDRADLNAICTALGIASGSNKDVIVAAISKLESDKNSAQADATTKQVTIDNLNKQIPSLENQTKTVQNEADDWKQKAQDSDGHLYRDLFNQAESDLKGARDQLSSATETCNRRIAQLQNSTVSTATTSALWGELLNRIFHKK